MSREMTDYLKTVRKADTYLPVRENMVIFQDAVKMDVFTGKWQKHPDRKGRTQEIQLL